MKTKTKLDKDVLLFQIKIIKDDIITLTHDTLTLQNDIIRINNDIKDKYLKIIEINKQILSDGD